MRVDLRCGQAGVTEQALDASKIRAGVEQVRREAMPKFMRA